MRTVRVLLTQLVWESAVVTLDVDDDTDDTEITEMARTYAWDHGLFDPYDYGEESAEIEEV